MTERKQLHLWGRAFHVDQQGMAIDEIVPFVSHLVFMVERLMDRVGDLERKLQNTTTAPPARGNVPLWGRNFTLVESGLAIDEVVPMVAELMTTIARLEAQVAETTLLAGKQLSFLTEADVSAAVAAADLNRAPQDEPEPEAPTVEPDPVPASAAEPPVPTPTPAGASWEPSAALAIQCEPEPAAARPTSPAPPAPTTSWEPSPAIRLASDPVTVAPPVMAFAPEAAPPPNLDRRYSGDVMLLFRNAATISDVVEIQQQLGTIAAITGVLGVTRGAEPRTLEVLVRLDGAPQLGALLDAIPNFKVLSVDDGRLTLDLRAA